MSSTAPTDNLVRALIDDEASHLRAADGTEGRTLFGHFAVFNRWTEVDSMWEGHFLERIAPGAFTRTFAEHRDRIKVLYDHGKDPQLGNKPLGPITELKEDKRGAYYEVDLIDTDYNDRFVIPAANAGLLGASFRFKVTSEEWVEPRNSTKANPDKLPERTINVTDVYEFGPVTFPQYEAASAGVRSGTDDFIDHLAHDPRFLARFTERAGLVVVERLLDALPPSAQTPDPASLPPPAPERADTPDDPADGQPSPVQWTADKRRQFARQIEAEAMGIGKGVT
jgi:hypothetical protein